MKNMYSAGLLGFLLFTAFTTQSQVEPPVNQHIPDKPSLFASLPDSFECSTYQLEKIFAVTPPQKISVRLNTLFEIDGVVAEKFERSNHFTTINVKLNNYADALFNISRIEDKEGLSYIGRIVSINHSDLLLLRKEKGKYFFIRQKQEFYMVE
jgi:hypothetical protein